MVFFKRRAKVDHLSPKKPESVGSNQGFHIILKVGLALSFLPFWGWL